MQKRHPGVQSAFCPDLDEDAHRLLISQTACLLTVVRSSQEPPQQHAPYTDEQAEDDNADCLLHSQPAHY